MAVSSPESWRDALEQHCRQHACLQATLLQLTEVGNNGEAQVSWELPRSSDVIKPNEYEKFKVGGSKTNSAAAEANSSLTSTPRKVYNAAKTIIGGIYSTVRQYAKDEDEYWQDMEPEQETRQSFSPVALDQPLVHVDLTRQCLSTILEEVSKKTSQDSSSSSSLIYRRPPWVFLARSDWTVWARNCTSSVFPAPKSLALHDTDWLLEVLIANHHCRILSRKDVHKSDIVIFPLDVKTINTIVTEDAALQVPLALFDLRYSMKEIEQRLEQWTHQLQTCSQKALEYKRKSQGKLALAQMARRKLLQEQIDAQSSTLLQLERVYNSIDTAQSNQSLLSLLSEGTQLLKQLSNETPVKEIDYLQADLQDVLEQLEVTSVALASFHKNTVSDDDLLAELASLTISDNHTEVEPEPEALAERLGLAQVSSKDSSQDGAPDQDDRKAQQLEPMAC